MSEPVTAERPLAGYSVIDDVAVITLDAPPVNALSASLRRGLIEAVERAATEPQVRAVVVTGAGKLFCAGADIREFGKQPVEPSLPDVLAKIEASPKPVVAAVNGPALGGGCELTLACHARVAGPRARFGLPEAKLGLIPGAGGTQRLPRILAPAQAFAMMLSGEASNAMQARAKGLADEVADDPVAAARAFALRLADAGSWPVTSRREIAGDASSREALSSVVSDARKKHGALLNTGALVRAVEAALTLPFEQGLAIEREEFLKLIPSDQAVALRHVFFAERASAQIPGIGKGVLPRTITRVAVIGAGTMGGGIAMTFANAGLSVRLIETSQALLDKGIERIRGDYAVSVKRGSMTQAALDGAMALIEGAVDLDVIAGADLIVEAAFEDMAVKRQIFGQIGRIAAPGAILATNTSYLDVNEIASASGRPADVLGLHFFSPANVMRLLEVVRGQATAPDVLATGVDLGRRLGKLPVVSGVCFGFIGNRMLAQRTRAAERLLLAGMSPADVDAAITGFGFRMGQFAMLDLAGIDIGWRTRKAFGGFAPVGDRLAEMGRFGQKTGRGYYLYPEGARKGVPDPDVTRIIADEAAVRGVAAESLSGDQLIERLFYPMVNEGARILDEGIAYRAADIDLVWINGYGWPNWMGGPMFWADGIGLSRIVESLEAQAARLNAPEIEPSSLLRRLAAEGRGFGSLTV